MTHKGRAPKFLLASPDASFIPFYLPSSQEQGGVVDMMLHGRNQDVHPLSARKERVAVCVMGVTSPPLLSHSPAKPTLETVI